ncbi:hypothetical protein M0811_13698 [Anaeramoeba ignava]|uniref:Uncharacterized protein n=1 Tax=Anaeramoeba ignava TaxID=1746090 RepID=A0A9Q0R441_ANAIG|nr:hypothetical protein M0811_13698 [Anaeramoeba ignava]
MFKNKNKFLKCPPPSPLTPTYSRCYQPSGLSNLDIRNVLNPFSLNKSYSDLFDKSQFVKTHTRFRSVAPLTPLSLVLPPFPSLICVCK